MQFKTEPYEKYHKRCGHFTDHTSDLLGSVDRIGTISVEFAAVNEYYPTYHVMYRQVSEENVKKLKAII